MPISLTCPCGRQLRVKDELAGKLIRCPDCSDSIRVSVPDAPSADGAVRKMRRQTSPGQKSPRQKSPAPKPAAPKRAAAKGAAPKEAVRKPVKKAASQAASVEGSQSENRERKAARKRPARKKAGRTEGRQSSGQRPGRPAKRRQRAEVYDDYDSYDDYDDYEDYDSYDDDLYGGDHNPYAASSGGRPARSRRRSAGKGDLTIVGYGLLLNGICMLALSGITAVTLAMVFLNPGPLALTMVMWTGRILIVAAIGMLIAELMCLAVPPNISARWLIIACVCCTVSMIAYRLFRDEIVRTNIALALAAMVISMTRVVTYMLFLRSIAAYKKEDGLATVAMVILFGFPAAGFAWFTFNLLLFYSQAEGIITGLMSILSTLLMIIAVPVFLVMYIFLHLKLGAILRKS